MRGTGQLDMLSIDAESSVPPFEQVRGQLAAAIRNGTLAPETRLPTVRTLAGDLGLAVNTVARSYKELELAGLVETRGRNGTFVAGVGSADSPAARAARSFLRRMRELGVTDAETLALVRREIESDG